MLVRQGKRAPRHKAQGGQPPQPVPAVPVTIPAPINGWDLSSNIATPAPGTARVLDNWVPTTSGIRVRGGHRLHATVSAPVTHLAQFTGANERLFACTAAGIFDVTAPADPEVAPAASVTGQTSGDYATAMFNIVGTDYLYFVNGADDPQLFNGSTFAAVNNASTPGITGTDPSNFSYVASYANRLFFVQKDSLVAWFLPVQSIGGAALDFSLAGVFRKGGRLLSIATFSSDSGEGIDDRIVFLSTEGEAAVYQGENPADANAWRKVGVYDIPKLIGKNSHVRAGGDVLLATESGIVPLSAAMQQDIAAVAGAAVTRPIAPYWQRKARTIDGDWHMAKVLDDSLMIVSQPGCTDNCSLCVNLQTGAWARWIGVRSDTLAPFNGDAYCADADGRVHQMDAGGTDNGAAYVARALFAFDVMGAPAATKTVLQVRPLISAATPFIAKLTFRSDFDETMPAPPSPEVVTATDGWDVGLWDSATWDGGETSRRAVSEWRASGATGVYLAPDLQISSNSTVKPDVALVSIDAMLHVGEVVT